MLEAAEFAEEIRRHATRTTAPLDQRSAVAVIPDRTDDPATPGTDETRIAIELVAGKTVPVPDRHMVPGSTQSHGQVRRSNTASHEGDFAAPWQVIEGRGITMNVIDRSGGGQRLQHLWHARRWLPHRQDRHFARDRAVTAVSRNGNRVSGARRCRPDFPSPRLYPGHTGECCFAVTIEVFCEKRDRWSVVGGREILTPSDSTSDRTVVSGDTVTRRRSEILHTAIADAPVPLAKRLPVRVYHNCLVRCYETLGKYSTQDVDTHRPASNQSHTIVSFSGGGICRSCIDMHILLICLQCAR